MKASTARPRWTKSTSVSFVSPMGTPSKNSSVPIDDSTLSGVVRFSGIGIVFFMTGCWVIILILVVVIVFLLLLK